MSRPGAVVFYVTLFTAAVYFVCIVNAEYIMRDAVVGVSFVAGLYMMFLLPAAAAGAAAVSLKGIKPNARGGVALIFAFLLALLLELHFAASASEALDSLVAKLGMLFILGINVVVVLSYFGIGAFFAKRGDLSSRAVNSRLHPT